MPMISIIIPTLNEEEFLPILLKCIKEQTFQDFEVIVADAGSKDKTREIAESFNAKVVDGGLPGPGRNRGAAVATGDFYFFFDADVILKPDFLEKALSEMNERFLDLATCEFLPDSDLRLDKVMFRAANLTVKVNQYLNPRAAGFCIFITKRLFQRIGGFDEAVKLAEDHDLVTRAALFRPLRMLESITLSVSIRRLRKEGRFSLIGKYIQVETHLLLKGKVTDDIIEYEFGNFEKQESESIKKSLDELEGNIVKMEEQYNQIKKKYGEVQTAFRDSESQDKFKNTISSILDLVKTIFPPKKA
jgi:glycosyltransferase involved in cell wall biosynthesis